MLGLDVPADSASFFFTDGWLHSRSSIASDLSFVMKQKTNIIGADHRQILCLETAILYTYETIAILYCIEIMFFVFLLQYVKCCIGLECVVDMNERILYYLRIL